VEYFYHSIIGAFFTGENQIYNYLLQPLVGYVTKYTNTIARLALTHVLNRVAMAVTCFDTFYDRMNKIYNTPTSFFEEKRRDVLGRNNAETTSCQVVEAWFNNFSTQKYLMKFSTCLPMSGQIPNV